MDLHDLFPKEHNPLLLSMGRSQTAQFPKEEMEAERNGASCAKLGLSGEAPVSFIQSSYLEFKLP